MRSPCAYKGVPLPGGTPFSVYNKKDAVRAIRVVIRKKLPKNISELNKLRKAQFITDEGR